MINIEICREAKKKIEAGPWHYLVGGAENELALRRNRAAFQQWAFVPRVLKDVSQIDLSTQFLGIKLRLPVMAAPIGGLTQFHPQGDLEWARGLSQSQIIGITSGVARVEIEKIIQETKTPLFFQLYFFGDDAWVKDRLQSAQASGYRAIVVTVDTPYFGQRERDIIAKYDSRNAGWRSAPPPPDRTRNMTLDWDKIVKMRRYTKLPLILKGIVSNKDIAEAIKRKIDAVWISNHGGRQLDHSLSSLESLTRVSALCAKAKIPVIFDGGARRGADILLAWLLGADVVALGRLPVYGLIYDGATGMKLIFDNLAEELKNTMGLVGITNFKKDRKNYKDRITPVKAAVLNTIWDKLEE